MKKSMLILFILASCSIFSQSDSNLESLLEKLEENHMGSVSDVFSPAEQQILRAHFDALHENNITDNRDEVDYLHGPNNSENIFGQFLISDPETIMTISDSPLIEFEGAGAWDHFGQNFKVIDNAGSLWNLSLSGNYEYDKDLTFPTGESCVGLAFDLEFGTLYGLSTDAIGSSTLSTIDTDKGTVTPIGNTGIMLPINLAIDQMGFAYSIGVDGNFSYRINLVTAEATELGPSGYDPNFAQGATYDHNTNEVYLSAFNDASFKSELRRLDRITGMTTYLGDIGSVFPGGIVQMGWTASPFTLMSVMDFNNFNFSFYPNPAKDMLTLKANENIETITIFNILGQKVISQKIGALTSTIDIAKLSSGNYILNVSINNQTEAYKLIKQ